MELLNLEIPWINFGSTNMPFSVAFVQYRFLQKALPTRRFILIVLGGSCSFTVVNLTPCAFVIIRTHGGDRSSCIGRDGSPTAILCLCGGKTLTEKKDDREFPPRSSLWKLRWINLIFLRWAGFSFSSVEFQLVRQPCPLFCAVESELNSSREGERQREQMK